jgi:hypothetical protein
MPSTARRGRTSARRAPPVQLEAAVLAEREASRRGPDWIAGRLGVPARTVSRILRRHHCPRPAGCDPLTGRPIR